MRSLPRCRCCAGDVVVLAADVCYRGAQTLNVETFPQGEKIIHGGEVNERLFIVQRGVVGGKGRVFTAGKVRCIRHPQLHSGVDRYQSLVKSTDEPNHLHGRTFGIPIRTHSQT